MIQCQFGTDHQCPRPATETMKVPGHELRLRTCDEHAQRLYAIGYIYIDYEHERDGERPQPYERHQTDH